LVMETLTHVPRSGVYLPEHGHHFYQELKASHQHTPIRVGREQLLQNCLSGTGAPLPNLLPL
jgi:hypothetical protein